TFFQNISHELRTPLTLIMHPLAKLFQRSPEDQDIKIALQNSNRLFRLVNQLLDFQKLSSKTMEIKFSPVNINKFLSNCCEYFRPTCSIKNIDLVTNFENKDDIFILAQIDALEKIIFNYLANAFKYSPHNGTIGVSLNDVGNEIVISVKDDGPGISSENQKKLFKVFSQIDDSTIREHEGTGLGLALVKELTEAMKGEVFVTSKEGDGALFGVKFKKHDLTKTSNNEENILLTSINAKDYQNFQPKKWHIAGIDESLSEEDDEENPYGEGKLILVIDDLKDMRDLIISALKTRAYRYITAKDGQEGLKKAETCKPDLVILDWMMPKLSGPEVIEGMLKSSEMKSIPTILLTAKSDEESRILGIKKGAHAYLGKPFDEIELISTVENLIHLKESEDKIKELNRNLTENVLKRFLPSKLVDDIINGKKIFDNKPQLMDVTILFANLVDFTDKAENLGARIIARILNEYFGKMTKIIFRHEGTIDKFIGDGIMVIFGAPEIQNVEIQVKNAAECARYMQEAIRELNIEWKSKHNMEFSMRIGLHRGSGIVGTFGAERSEYTVIGPVVNMASKIEKIASPGTVYFSAAVRDNLKDGWSVAGTFDLKGLGKIPLFKLDDIKEDQVKKAV
ncbi:MAG: response regulator, partial [Oligoflexales bacterium]|nr:response regulator [Oligoflexales bacterium]